MYISSASTTNHFDLLINEVQLLSKYVDNTQTLLSIYLLLYILSYYGILLYTMETSSLLSNQYLSLSFSF